MRFCRLRSVRSACLLILLCLTQGTSSLDTSASKDEERDLGAFAAFRPVDSHVHVFKTDPAFQALLEKLNLKLLNILVVDDTLSYRKQLLPHPPVAMALVRSSRGHIELRTTFDPYRFSQASFAPDAIQQLNEDFRDGAIAVKLWKNVGMEIKDSNGKYVMADDPKFRPVFQGIES